MFTPSAGPGVEIAGRRSWVAQANCLGADPRLFFPDSRDVSAALAVCRDCLVREQCLQYALDAGERFGVWGGLSERQRTRLRRTRARRRPSRAAANGRVVGALPGGNPPLPRVVVHPADGSARAALRRLSLGAVETYLARDSAQADDIDDVYVVRADGAAVGFAVIRPGDRQHRHTALALCVARREAARGVGQLAGRQLLQRYEGAWELVVGDDRPGAIAFWRAVIPARVEESRTGSVVRLRFRIGSPAPTA